MPTLLVIQPHPHIDNSLSLTVGQQFIDSYKAAHPADQVIIRDLYTPEGVPPLNDQTMEAWRKQKFGEKLTADEEQLLNRHSSWLTEFIKADKYVFINPMYNHFLPAELKQYLDLTAVAHKTFKYTAEGPVGLLKGKKALHIQAAGGIYHRDGGDPRGDLGDLYLTKMLNFYGVNDVDKLFIEGADAHRDQRQAILDQTLADAKTLAAKF